MDISNLRCFLSEDNISLHKDHYGNLLSLSNVIYKSFPALKDVDPNDLKKIRIKSVRQNEYLPALNLAHLHKIFFGSFTDKPARCDYIRKWYSSEDDFLYGAYLAARESFSSFVYFFVHRDGRPDFKITDGESYSFEYSPVLAVDLFEHSYFMDYGFDRDRYIRRAFSVLNLEKLGNYFKEQKSLDT